MTMDVKVPKNSPPTALEPGRDVNPKVREEEVCRIFNLKENLDYSDVLIKYAQRYLKLGWDLVAVNALEGRALDLDFQQAEEMWSPKITSLGLEGVRLNLGVRTGSPSRLLVLEVHRTESQAPFNQPGDWRSGCVAEVGNLREQHYYMLPRGWQPPSSYFLETFQIMVFGEEGMVLAPPSLEPEAQTALRWLRPPWESPPTRPSPALCKFLKESAPPFPGGTLPPLPQVPTWSEVYPRIISYPSVLQALLAPAATPEEYYQNLMAAAQGVGLRDPHLLLGLLWHAPRGEGTPQSQRWDYFQRLVRRSLKEGSGRVATAKTQAFLPAGEDREHGMAEREAAPQDFPAPPASAAPDVAPPPRRQGVDRGGNGHSRRFPPEAERGHEEFLDSWEELFRLSRHHLWVDRQRYEAMIYELGKWGAWQEILKRLQQENRGLKRQMETQWTKELEFLRQLSLKSDRKGGRKW